MAEASVMVDENKSSSAQEALSLATAAAKAAQAEIAPDLETETNEKVRRAALLLGEGWEDIEAALETQLDEEEKTRIALIVSKSRLSYCNALAQQDFAFLESDPKCNIEKAPELVEDDMPPECIDAGVTSPRECARHMMDRYGFPPECEGLSDEECIEFMHEHGGVPGGMPLECAGLSNEECEQVMFEKFAPPECKDLSREECETLMMDRGGPGPGGPGPGGPDFGSNECEGLSRDECDELMWERYAPEHCKGVPREECFDDSGHGGGGAGPDFPGPDFRDPLQKCKDQGIPPEQCEEDPNYGLGPDDFDNYNPGFDGSEEFDRDFSGYDYSDITDRGVDKDFNKDFDRGFEDDGGFDREFDRSFDDGDFNREEFPDRDNFQDESIRQDFPTGPSDLNDFPPQDFPSTTTPGDFGDLEQKDDSNFVKEEDNFDNSGFESEPTHDNSGGFDAVQTVEDVTGNIIAFSDWLTGK
ncbi:hypothetical protein CMO88_04335 [Candidatus Woesearchaeota archaeon]|nr:hypothetical protein [Candidatus Woesearchaeota archaeon]